MSRDLIKWERRPAAIFRDQEYDNADAFPEAPLNLRTDAIFLMYIQACGKVSRRWKLAVIRHSAWRLVTEQITKNENNPVITADNAGRRK